MDRDYNWMDEAKPPEILHYMLQWLKVLKMESQPPLGYLPIGECAACACVIEAFDAYMAAVERHEPFVPSLGLTYDALNDAGTFPMALKSFCEERGLTFRDFPDEKRIEVEGHGIPGELIAQVFRNAQDVSRPSSDEPL